MARAQGGGRGVGAAAGGRRAGGGGCARGAALCSRVRSGAGASTLAALACEAVQFALATSTCWLLGLGYATPPHSLAKYSRLLSASALAVRSRVVTRPFRLLVELYLVPPIMKRIRALPPQRRRNAVSLAASSIVAALLALITAIQLLDLAFVAHTRSSAPPAALLIGSAYHHLYARTYTPSLWRIATCTLAHTHTLSGVSPHAPSPVSGVSPWFHTAGFVQYAEPST